MNDLEQMKKKRNRISAIIAILIVLNLLLLLVFATNVGDGDTNIVNYSGEEVETPGTPVIENEGDINIADVKTGANFTVALDSNGKVWAWGQNNKGQLGNGTINDSVSKTAVLLKEVDSKGNHLQLSNVKQIAVGEYHAVALTKNGEVYIWGYNYFGQTGSTSKRKELYPLKVSMPSGEIIKQIASGADYTLALSESGNIFGLGDSSNGQLGYYNDLAFTSIRDIEEFKETKQLTSIKEISAGYDHVVALDNNNKVWTWGDTTGSGFDFTEIKEITGIEGTVVKVVAGNKVSMALTSDGKVYTWDSTSNTPTLVTLPDKEISGDETEAQKVQIRIEENKDSIAIVNQTYYMIDTENNVYGWGQNSAGQVGNGTTSTMVSEPTKLTFNDENSETKINHNIDKLTNSVVAGVSETGASAATGNYDTAYAINADGYVLGWGYAGLDITDVAYTEGSNTGKLLGDASRQKADYIGSISVKSIVGDDIEVEVGGTENLLNMLKEKGYITGGRVNLYRQEPEANVETALEVRSVNEDIASYKDGIVTGITAGRTAAEVKTQKNSIYINIKVTDKDAKAFAKIETRTDFTVALKADGTVWAWGKNDYLGITDTIHTNQRGGIILPTQVQGLEDVKDIAVGENFVLVLKIDGTVWAWGRNNYGQLGNGTVDTREVASIMDAKPELTQVQAIANSSSEAQNLSNIVEISAGANSVMALDTNGTVWAWGRNDYRQLGNGSTASYEVFAKEVDLSNLVDEQENKEVIKQIEVGNLASFILTKSGYVYACGYNGSYLCGNSGATYIPTKIDALNKITKISVGTYSNGYPVAITVNGDVWVWGYYSYWYNSGYPRALTLSKKVVDVESTDNNLGAIFTFADGTVGYSTNIYTSVTPTIYQFNANGEEFKNATLINGANGSYVVAKADGTVWTSGYNYYGNLGNRTVINTNAQTLNCISKDYISLDKHEITLKEGQSENISAKYNYGFNLLHSGTKDVEMEYTSLNEAIATVSGNTIKGVKSGKTYIEAKDKNGVTLRVIVNVLSEKEEVTPKVSVGYDHTIALKADGTVWGFGYNNYGELGAYKGAMSEPENLGFDGIKDIAAGEYYTLMLRNDGKVSAMGYNGHGRLGNNSTTNSTTPVLVQTQVVDGDGNVTYVDLDNIVKVSAIGGTSLALDKDGNMYAWGYNGNSFATKVNTYGLKVKDISEKLILTEDGRVWEYETPTSLKFVEGLNNIVEVSSSTYSNSTSYGYFMALDGQGNVYTWIKNGNDRVTGTETTVPTKLEIATEENAKIVDIEAGVRFAVALDNNGNAYSWGQNANLLGQGESVAAATTPTKIDAEKLSNIESIATSKYYNNNGRTYAVAKSGSVYGFGTNGNHSLLGNGETVSYYYEPTLVGQNYAGFIVDGKPTVRVYMNKGESINLQASLLDAFNLRLTTAATTTETDFEWSIFNEDLVKVSNVTGTNNTLTAQNIIGEAIVVATDKITGKTAKLYVDVKPTGTEVAPKIESVGDHTVALKADGTVWVWGGNSYGELGILQKGNIKEPKQARIAERIPTDAPIEKTNEDGSLATTEDGKQIYVDTEGNEYYKLGDNYTDINGKLVIKYDSKNGALYKWDSEENNYALKDLTNENGDPIIVTDIATTNYHTLMLTKDGDVYSCGYNYYGQLGYSTSDNYQDLPKKVNGLKDIVKVAVGDNYSLALDKYGRLWTFGYPSHFHVNTDSYCHKPIKTTTPTKVTKFDYVDISEILQNTIDISNRFLLTKDGEVIALRLYSTDLVTGTKIEGITGKVIKITSTSGSYESGHTAFLTDNGTVYTIGNGAYGQLGNDTWTNSVTSIGNKYTAVQVENEEGIALDNIRDVYAGANHTIAIAKDGSVYTWGRNINGELRSSVVKEGENLARAYKVAEDSKIKDAILVSGGNGFSVVVDSTGFAYAWGLGTNGRLGNGLGINSIEARRVGIDGIRLDKNHITLKENGKPIEVNAYNKQLNLIYNPTIDINANPISTDTNIAIATKVEASKLRINPVSAGTTSAIVKNIGDNGEESISIIQITVLPEVAEISDDVTLPADRIITPMTVSGDSHTLILKSDGTVLAYGDNTYGQTAAQGKYSDKATVVEFPEGTPSIIQVAAGDNFSMALDINGNVYTWGYNGNGELGLGTTSSVNNKPTIVPSLSNIVKIKAGANHCIALDRNGYVYTWGRNISGSLGIGSTASVIIPIQIDNIAGVIDIAAGQDHSMILTSDGNVYASGSNASGQLGEQYILNRINFTKVEIANPIEYIEAGSRTSIAIDTTGKLWVWGENADGQLGLGIEDQKVYTPTISTVGSGANVVSASAGLNHIEVVTTSGELYVAGSNNYGQLGIGSNIERAKTFTKVPKLGNNVMRANAGTTYSTAIAKDGTVYGFGDYNHGDVNKISLTNSFEPVMLSDNTSFLDEQEVIVRLGENYSINANGRFKLNVLHKDNSTFEYKSANDTIASVDENGVITGLEIGTTMVTAKDEVGKVSAIIVKVLPEDAIQSPAIEGGKEFAAVTDKSGILYLFGNKENIIDRDVPSIINDSISLKTVKAGDDFVVAVNNDGTVWALGDNTYGQLGIDGIENSNQIVRLNTSDIKNITQIDAGSKHVIALDELGRVYVWGDNSQGQLGISATQQPMLKQPTVIRPTTNRIISVSAGGNYSSIVDSSGKVYIIGRIDVVTNDGIIKQDKVLGINGIKGAVKVATGEKQTLVLTNDGLIHLVDNATGTHTLVSNKNIVDIATNNNTFMCLTADKALYTFGDNKNGELGIGISNNSSSNLNLAASDVFTIGGGNTNTYYINTEGEVFATGLNISGELGNGTSTTTDASTYGLSRKYTKVGNREYNLKEVKKNGTEKAVKSTRVGIDWTIFVGKEEIKSLVGEDKTKVILIKEDKEFNAFGKVVNSADEYTFKLTDMSKASLKNTDKAEIVAKQLGETTLQVTNEVTKETQELKIVIVDDKLLRIEDIYVLDSDNKVYNAEEDKTSDFIVNVEGSKDSGTLNIVLEFEDDTLEAFNSEGNKLTVTKDETTGEWIVEGLDLTKVVQEITLKITSANGEEFEYKVTIRKEMIVKVDSETLAPQDDGNYIKFVNPTNEQATVEVTVLNNEYTINLKDEERNIIGTQTEGSNTLEKIVNVPNKENVFIIEVLDGTGKVIRKSNLTIFKSSIESIFVKDIVNVPQDVKAEKIDGTDGYVDEFNVKIDESNNPAEVTINVRNKDVKTVIIDGVEYTVNSSMVKFTTDKDIVEIEVPIKDLATDTVSYTEKYKLAIYKVSANTNIKEIELTTIEGNKVTLEDPIFKVSKNDEHIYGIVLHDKEIDLKDKEFGFKVTLEDEKATVSINSRTYKESGWTFNGISKDYPSENKCQFTIYVKAENGRDIQKYTLIIYRESEDAGIDTIKTQSPIDDGSYVEKVAVQKEGTNDYIGKVINGKDQYKVVIKLNDAYAKIEKIGIKSATGEIEETSILTLETNEKGVYTYLATPDIIGKTITMVTKAEYDGIASEEHTLKIEILDDNAAFESIQLGSLMPFTLDEENIEAQIGSKDSDKLTVKAQSEYAKVEIYSVDPRINSSVAPIATGTGEVSKELGILEGQTTTVYMKITSEDEQNTQIKSLTVKRKSSNTNIKTVILDGNEFEYVAGEVIEISESAINKPTNVKVVTVDEFATAKVEGEDNSTGAMIDLTTKDTIEVEVTSEDGIVATHTVKVKVLSSNTEIEDMQIQDKNGAVIKSKGDFVKDTAVEDKYNVKVKNIGKVDLVITPANKKTTVEFTTSKDSTPVVGNRIELNTADTTEVYVKLTAEDGTVKTYTIVVSPEDPILQTVHVNGANSSNVALDDGRNLTSDELNNNYAEVRVHPDSTKATINLSANALYVPVTVEAIVNKGMIDEDGNSLETKVTGTIGASGAVINVELLDADKTTIAVDMTTNAGIQDTLVLDIVRGNKEAKLDKVTVKGTTTEDEETAEYKDKFSANIGIDSLDSIYNIIPLPANNGTYKLYRISEENKDTALKDINLDNEEDITNNSQVELNNEYQRFVIEVTAEFGSATQRYDLYVKKVSSNTNISDLTITVNGAYGEVVKKLADFGTFDSNNSIDIIVPAAIKDLRIDNLVLEDSLSSAVWTEVIANNNENYKSSEEAIEYTKIIPFDLQEDSNTVKHVYIKVTAENGDEKVYYLNIKKAKDDIRLMSTTLYDVTNSTDVKITNSEATITESTIDSTVTSKANELVSIKVTKVNGFTVNERIATEAEIKGENSLDINFNTDYTYIDKDEVEQTILAADVTDITVETTVRSMGSVLYPTYYENTQKQTEAKYELNIRRFVVDKNIIIEILNADDSTNTIDTKTTDFIAKEENGETVYEYVYKVPSTHNDELVISNVKAHNTYAVIEHRLNSGNNLYTEDNPHIGTFVPKATDKSSATEEFVVIDALENSVKYRLVVTKASGNDDIGKIVINNKYEAKHDTSIVDKFNGIILAPVNRLNVAIQNVEENAKVEMNIASINGTNVSVSGGELKESESTTGTKQVVKDLTTQLENALSQVGIDKNDVTNIVVNITVQAEDETIPARVYKLNIDVIKSNLLSINGLDADGNIGGNEQLTASDFHATSFGVFETEEIPVPSDTVNILLEKILCEKEGMAVIVIKDEDGNDITESRELIVPSLPKKVVINTKVDNIEQQFIINIRKRSTDTTIKEVKADENTTNTPNEEDVYVVNVKDTSNPKVKVTLTDSNAKVIDVVPVLNNITASIPQNNEFTISGIAADKHNTAEDSDPTGKTIDVVVTVEAEDGNTKDYTIRLERKHTETGLGKVEYFGDKDETATFESTDVVNREISSTTNGITIKSAQTVCSNAKVYVEYEDATGVIVKEPIDATKVYEIAEGTTKTFKLIVVAEYGNEKAYTLNVRRKSANTGIKGIQVNVNERTEEAKLSDTIENVYTANINIDEDPQIVVSLEDANSIVSGARVYKSNGDLSDATVSEIKDNTFTISGLSNINDLVEHENILNREITVEIDVQAEDTSVVKTYKLILTRRHIETGINDVTYTYDGVTTPETVEFDDTEPLNQKATVTVGSAISSVNFAEVISSCDKAKVSIKVDGEEIQQNEAGFSVDLVEAIAGDGCIKTIAITVTAEAGNKATYTIKVTRMASNASLNKVIVNDIEATRENSEEDGIEAIFKANVKDSDIKAAIEAISANITATVSITNEKYTTIDNGIIYDETGTYDLSSETQRDVEVLITVTPEDTSVPAKTYKLIMTRKYDSTILNQINVKPVVEGITDAPIILTDNEEHNESFGERRQQYYGWRYSTINYWYQTETILIPTEWSSIAIGDILPDATRMPKVEITRISEANPYSAGSKGAYTIDTPFAMPEGEHVYFKVVTTAESGSERVYVIDLYKKATNTNVTIKVDGEPTILDENDGIYKINADANKNTLPITIIGENKLSKADTNIVITVNGEDVTELLRTTKTGDEKQITFTLNDILKALDFDTGRKVTAVISVVPEDTNIPAKDYTVEIIRQHTSAEISKVIGNSEEIAIDDQRTHYEYVGKDVLDKDIYTKYITSDTNTVLTEVIAESEFATVTIFAEDGTELVKGTGKATYEVATEDLLTRLKVEIVSEDGKATKYCEVWFIKKSDTDDVTIAELYVDGEAVPADPTDGNYYIEISDSIKQIEAKLIPNYKFANVSINGQPYKWQEATEIIDNLDKAILVDGKVRIELRVQIPATQSSTGENKVSTKYLFINRVSTDNGIEKILTDNAQDKVTPGNKPQSSDWGEENTYSVLLEGTGVERNVIDLTIVPVSPKATVELLKLDGTVMQKSEGTLIIYSVPVDKEQITTYKVRVTPQQGEAKEYYIDITPKASQAELKEFAINGNKHVIELEPGVYQYNISNLGLTGLGEIYALATANSVYPEDNEYGSATVKIYTRGNPDGSGEQATGEATLGNVDLDNTTYITITVQSPNGAKTSTYTIWLQDVSDDSSLQGITYTDKSGNVKEAIKTSSTDPKYAYEYEVVLDSEQDLTNISITATSELSKVIVESEESNHILNITKDVKSMTEDIVLDVIVEAESGNESIYKLTIKKPTTITGKIITENAEKDYSGIELSFVKTEAPEEVVATATTKEDGTYSIELPAGINYNMVISKPGYLTYTMTNIPVTYGVRRYTGHTYLVAGEVTGDGNINLVDLVKVNMKARENTPANTNSEYDFYDLNEDGIISELDVKILTKNYNMKAISVPYVRMVELSGEILDATKGDAKVSNANVELREVTATNTNGEFVFENVIAKEYVLTVTDETGTILGSENITIKEGTDYDVTDNIITLAPNMIELDITVRVNGSRAVVSKRGEAGNQDMTNPVIENAEAEITPDGVKLTAELSDANLSSVTLYGEDGTEIATQKVTGNKANVEITKEIETTFGETYKFYVEVVDTSGNTTRQYLEVKDNIIRKADDLVEFSKLVSEGRTYENETVTLDTDVDLAEVAFTPIGKSGAKYQFKGTFDGAGHIININISSSIPGSGLFGYTNGATIKNLGVTGTVKATKVYAGGIVGSATNTTIENCYSNADVISENSQVGGIIGRASGTTTVINCYNIGNVTGSSNVGGIIGRLDATEGTIENCYSIGIITGDAEAKYTGEIIGYRFAKKDNMDENLIHVASVTNCYYSETSKGIGTTSDLTSSVESEMAKLVDTTEEITDIETLLTNLGEAYKIEVELNNGYPVLQWEQMPIQAYSLSGDMILPISEEYTVTSEFDLRDHPVTGEANVMHYGIDLATNWKSDVFAVADGTVVFAGENGGYGYCIEIEHTINGETIRTLYGHLYEMYVEVGDTVELGQAIALVGGMPGTQGAGVTTGPHLHFEVREISGSNSSAVDPRNYLEF